VSAVDFMAQPSTMFEPADPRPLRQVFLTADEFNAVAVRHKKPIEVGPTHAFLVVGSVEYIASISEPCS
jgi:hypothetical protein